MSYWPRHLPRSLARPELTLYGMLAQSVERHPRRAAIRFFGTTLDYAQLLDSVERFAGWLQRRAGVRRGERVLLYLQSSPQWLIAYYGALRADAVVVPVNPMNRAGELAHYLADSEARVAVCGEEMLEAMRAASGGSALRHIVTARYGDYLPDEPRYEVPGWLSAPARPSADATGWLQALEADERAQAPAARAQDLCLLPYTSGSTGVPKACMHTHETFMHTTAGLALWHWMAPGIPFLAVTPMYHVAGLAHSVHLPVYTGGTAVILPRWDRRLAAQLIERERIAHAAILPTAVIDLLAADDFARHDLSSLRRVTAGGASMPTEVAHRLHQRLGLEFIEAYGMTETAATTHNNPIERPKRQCLGIPFFDTDARVVDLDTLQPRQPGESGEILVRGPQLFKGYWNRPEEDKAAFVEIDGLRFFRTGDIGHEDEEGYFFMTDRAKRMINASGYKVWPAEVESMLHQHPHVKEVCVVGTSDAYRGETVKALVVLTAEGMAQRVSADELMAWAKERMAAYKYPRIVEIREQLPKSPVGKILWKELQDMERGG